MKKLLALLLAMMMVFALSACSNNEISSGNDSSIPDTLQTDNQGSEENKVNDGQDYDNVGFTKVQRQVIAEQIGVTTEGEKVVFMYVPDDGDEVIYYDVYDQFNGNTCRYTEYCFCLNKDAYDGEYSGMKDSYDDLKADEKNLYLYGSEEADFTWAGSYQAIVDYHNEHTAPYNDEYVIVK